MTERENHQLHVAEAPAEAVAPSRREGWVRRQERDLDMRPTSAARDRGGLDPSSYHTSSSIQGALRGAQQSGGSVGSGPPGLLLVLMVVAVALPAVSFFAMHARMLDRQEVLSNNYAVRDGPVRYHFALTGDTPKSKRG